MAVPVGPAAVSPAARVTALDALRGFALCGILLVNLPAIAHMAPVVTPGAPHPAAHLLDLVVRERFFPIFSFLFGVSFALFLDRARARNRPASAAVARRLAALAVLGFAHQLLQPGEALLPYAVAGLLVLLPASWLPWWAVTALGLLATLAGVVVASGGVWLVPGLFLLGLATARRGVFHDLASHRRSITWLCVGGAVPGMVLTAWQHVAPENGHVASIAGLFLAAAYASAVLLLVDTRVGRAAAVLLEPMGRMALTNYVMATVLVLLANRFLGLTGSHRWGAAFGLALVVLALQAGLSRWWLTRFRYGPLEWWWRCVTWFRVVPNPRGTHRRRLSPVPAPPA
ncbi:putative membrane protein YeiB [Streptoalloteichus tenebrarius]|uniref:Membrane protein YeiB n=1 Tax=Streptoalloteichus tenebrarius (strain ATCC 17920 / DSM 40477 / JCM 4838 / CBS 697.72 / NBRC 16177 / NCIMB 11028 / NRRL B-12390 / A12253. 1 / ISP 5477) TaxID=1933 RepID=A0ABT1I1U0_STRSD|nr:DUF418 domain-containing protein [Streptoalloteichus tenebrarius]MCP2261749.1 putative membrane protein YeiB [Streptoalloteichus tenebrarius]BFF00804.1 DUF418 domain-containing protein [Streptoalloteichus tenebrarius]